jgi:hypothetical protein
MTERPSSGYYAPLHVAAILQPSRAWTIYIGQTPAGEWVAEYHSIAASRYQRSYFASEAEARAEAEKFGAVV